MKTPLKILILFMAVCVCVAAVLIFQKTMVSPPTKLTYADQYEAYVSQQIEDYKKETTAIEPGYILIMDLIERLNLENDLNGEKRNKATVDFIEIYTPKFTDWSFSQFRESEWNPIHLKFIEKRIKDLKELPISNNPALKDQNYTALNRISKVLTDYKDASSLARQTTYVGWDNSSTKIAKAKEYAQDDYLRYNKSLQESLNALSGQLVKSHLNYLKQQVNQLKFYQSWNEDYYERLENEVLGKIDEYQQKIYNVYGNDAITRNIKEKEIPALREEANRYIVAAENYYYNQAPR